VEGREGKRPVGRLLLGLVREDDGAVGIGFLVVELMVAGEPPEGVKIEEDEES
jgi:hypothetical protein